MVSLTTMVRLSIIILSYNTKSLILDCIASIVSKHATELANGEFEIIVVDNASTDGSQEAIAKYFAIKKDVNASFHLIKNTENSGFSKGCNIGAAKAQGKYFLFLNSDTELRDTRLLSMMQVMEDDKRIGIVGGKLFSEDGLPQEDAGNYYTIWNVLLLCLGLKKFMRTHFTLTKKAPVEWVIGALLMVKAEVFSKLNGFDEHFFMYVEDMDFCYRASHMGYEIWFYPDIRVLHKEQGSSNRSFAVVHIYKGIVYFFKKHKGHVQYIIVKEMLTIRGVIAIMIGTTLKNDYLINTYKEAIKF